MYGNTTMTSESAISKSIRAEASRKGMRLWRNNVGAVTTDDGRHIRFGLANDSAKLNRILKSGDLIGIRPVIITQGMVGMTFGQFISREVKHSGWVARMSDDRTRAQQAWIDLINSMGGDACFATSEGTL